MSLVAKFTHIFFFKTSYPIKEPTNLRDQSHSSFVRIHQKESNMSP